MPEPLAPYSEYSKLEYVQAENATKYAVYVHYPSNENNKKAGWERASHTMDADLAMEQAQMLFESGRFEKVEVKKFSDEGKTQKRKSTTYKIFSQAKDNLGNHIKTALLVFGVSAAALIYFLF